MDQRSPSSASQPLVVRARVQAALTATANRDRSPDAPPVLLLRAPTGYGKTTAVRQWEAGDGSGFRIGRVVCGPGSWTEERFWPAVAAALSGGDAPRPEAALAVVHDAVAALRAPLTLVVDDYHHATDAERDLELARLTELSPMLSLAVLARHVRLLDGPVVGSRVAVRAVGRRELALTAEETAALARLSGVAEPAPELLSVLGSAEGWPTALRAMLHAGAATTPASAGERLRTFVLQHLELLDAETRDLLLSAAQLDTIDVELVASATGATEAGAEARVGRLLDLGLLLPSDGRPTDLACHPAVRRIVADGLLRGTPGGPEALVHARARRLAATDPFGAFRLLHEVGAPAEAEAVLAEHFTTITDRAHETLAILRTVPDAILGAHPTFAAARLFLEATDPTTPLDTLRRLTDLMSEGASRRLQTPEVDPALAQSALCQTMVASRLLGDAQSALALALRLEACTGSASAPAGALLVYASEIACTALMAGDLALARRNWQRLLANTANAAEHEPSWRACGLDGLALVHTIDGDLGEAAARLEEADAIRRSAGCGTAPGLGWVNGEAARAHLAYERQDPGLLGEVIDRVEPWADRIEPWPVLLIAEIETIRFTRGEDWALPQFEAALAQNQSSRRGSGSCGTRLVFYRAMLNTSVGDFVESERLLAALPDEGGAGLLERARLALFASDGVNGLLMTQRVGAAGLTKRQRVDRCLIAACSAWICQSHDEAFAALRAAADQLREFHLPSMLWGVPYDVLAELTAAAAEAGICDLAPEVAAVPLPARCHRYESLSEMERRTLEAVAGHSKIAHAADALFVAPGTVKAHLRSVYRKLRVSSRGQAILRASRMGILRLAPGTQPVRHLDDTFPGDDTGGFDITAERGVGGPSLRRPRASRSPLTKPVPPPPPE